jgi:hypothetical protein
VVYLEAELLERNSLVVLAFSSCTDMVHAIYGEIPAGLCQLESSIELLGSLIRLQALSGHIIGGIRG